MQCGSAQACLHYEVVYLVYLRCTRPLFGDARLPWHQGGDSVGRKSEGQVRGGP